MSPIRVVLADDHALVREGTRELLEHEEDIRVVAEAGDGQQAVQLASEMQPDVVIIDAAMPGMNGVEATQRIKACSPGTAVLLLSAYDNDAYVFASLEAGATGYLLKSSQAKELIQAVRIVHSGGSALHPTIARKLVNRLAGSPPTRHNEEAPPHPLMEEPSEREKEILKLAAKGWTNQDIARQLSIGSRTVQAHLSNVFSKTGTRSRTEAVVLALQREWINLDEVHDDHLG